jgi:DNA-binding NtrC family response regulator
LIRPAALEAFINQAGRESNPKQEVFMPLTVVLTVGLDSWLLEAQKAAWRSEGYYVISTASIKEAINHFEAGDFDLVLLGHSIPEEARERLAFLIRATGSRVPLACIVASSGQHDSFADATFEQDSSELLTDMGALLKSKARMPAA